MKKLILFLIFLFTCSSVVAAPPSRQKTYTSGTTILASDVTANEDEIFNYLQSGVDTYANDTIVNADINSSAAIADEKLDLASIAQAVTFNGAVTAGSTLTVTGALTANGAVTLGNASGDDITITGSIAASIPLKAETYDIGTTSIGLNDLHFGSGGIINFDGGDITLTHSAAKLTYGGDGAVEIDFNNHEMTNVDVNSGTLNGITSLGMTTVTGITDIVDEDNMASDSATNLSTQQSIKKYVDDSVKAFGSWTGATEGSSTQAGTDGFVVVMRTGSCTFSVKTDSASTPTTLRANYDTADGEGVSATIPVKSGEYYLIEGSSLSDISSYWIPLQ